MANTGNYYTVNSEEKESQAISQVYADTKTAQLSNLAWLNGTCT